VARDERRWTGWLFVALLPVVALAVNWVQQRPTGPPGAVPAAQVQKLAAEHGCVPVSSWAAGPAAELAGGPVVAGAIVATQVQDSRHLVAWVPASEAFGRWEPDSADGRRHSGWYTVQWCVR